MEGIILSKKLIEYLNEKKKSNIVIYRHLEAIGCCSGTCIKFVIKAKTLNVKKPNELLKKVITIHGISVWVELGILEQVKKSYVFIDLAGRILKGLKISIETFENVPKHE